MLFDWTKEANNYVAAQGKVFLNACPGSGKTTAVAYKLSSLVNNWESYYDSFAGIACLSFTNIAKDEINLKYREFTQSPLRYPHLISTIDSFINLHITLPHYHLLGYHSKRPVILDNQDYLDDWRGKWNNQFKMKNNKNIFFSYGPSTIELELDGS